MRFYYVMILALLSWSCRSSDSFLGTVMPETPVPDFALTDQYGQPFTLSGHSGKVKIFFFGYTFCPDVCPLTLSTWKRVQEKLEDDAEKVTFVYVTVDPERDSQEKLKTHLAVFSDDFIGLTGSPEALSEVYASFGVLAEKVKVSDSAAGYLVNHSTRMFVVDQTNMLRLLIDHDAPVDNIVHDIRLLLKAAK